MIYSTHKIFMPLVSASIFGLSYVPSMAFTFNLTSVTVGEWENLGAGETAFIVVDTLGDGWSGVDSGSSLVGQTLSIGSNLGGTVLGVNDLIIGTVSSSQISSAINTVFNTGVTAYDSTVDSYLSAVGAGDEIAIFWFDGVGEGDTVSGGQNFQFFRMLGANQQTSTDDDWVVPGDGQAGSLGAFSTPLDSINGTTSPLSISSFNGIDPAGGIAHGIGGSVIPEPSTGILVSLAVASILFRRRCDK